jgi:hypothetical protein
MALAENESVSKARQLSKKEIKLLVNSFIALKHIHRMIEAVEGDLGKISDQEMQKEIKHIWKRVRSGFFGSVRKDEKKVARRYSKLTEKLKNVRVSEEDNALFQKIILEGGVFNSALIKLESRGGKIEQALKEAMENPDDALKLKIAEQKVEEAITNVEGFQVEMRRIIDIVSKKKEYDGFSVKIDKKKAAEGYLEKASDGKGFIELYQEVLTETAIYNIGMNKEMIVFSIDQGETERATLHFKFEKSGLNLVHRIVNARDLGVSGTTFYKKAENYLKWLAKKGYLKEKVIYMEASQPAVIKWALKNGFRFEHRNYAKLYEAIMSGKNKNYVQGISVYDPKLLGGYTKVGYIANKKVFEKYKHLFGDNKTITMENIKKLMKEIPRHDKIVFRPILVKDI